MGKRVRQDSISELGRLETGSLNIVLPISPPLTETAHSPKIVHLEKAPAEGAVMECKLPPHGTISFSSHEEYEVHYRKEHANRCCECLKNFPSSHYLDLHQAENHNPINEARKARGEKIYGCFLKDCDRLFHTWYKRKLHSVDKHGFPKDYDFFIVNDGMDHRQSMLRINYHHRRGRGGRSNKVESCASTSTQAESQQNLMAVEEECQPLLKESAMKDSHTLGRSRMPRKRPTQDAGVPGAVMRLTIEDPLTDEAQLEVEVADIAKSMSVLRFVPRSVIMARSKAKSLQTEPG